MGRRVALRSAAALLLAAVVAGCICGVEADRLSKFQRKSSDPFTAVPERPAIQGGETADQKAQAEPLLDDNDGKTFKTVPTWSSCNVTGEFRAASALRRCFALTLQPLCDLASSPRTRRKVPQVHLRGDAQGPGQLQEDQVSRPDHLCRSWREPDGQGSAPANVHHA